MASLAEQVLAARGVVGEAELDVLFVDEATMASLNERFLGRAGPTDVLSFPVDGDLCVLVPEGRRGPPAGAPSRDGASRGPVPLLLGDVVICPAVAWRNAAGHAGSYDGELALLLVHGILHLLGMDHEDEAEAEEMEALERELLQRLAPAGTGP